MDFQDLDLSFLEASLSRGDHKTGDVIFNAWRRGARFDSWKEFFKIDVWKQAFSDSGLSLYESATKRYDFSESLPWDFIDTGTSKRELVEEAKKAGLDCL